jgi:acyl carrier protein
MPEYTEIEKELREILIEQEIIGTDQEINAQTNIRHDLGLDEFQIIELIGAIEEEYDISIPIDQAEQAQTIGQFVELIQRCIG